MKQVLAFAVIACCADAPAFAQPIDLPIPAASTTEFPAGISVAQSTKGPVYVDAQGRTLYGMDMRTVLRWGADPSKYCKDACAQAWEPALAPAGAKVNIAYPQGFGRRPGSPEAGGAVAPRGGTRDDPSFYSNPQRAPDWTVIQGPQGPQWVYKGWHMVYVRKGEAPGVTAYDGAEDFTWNSLKFVPPIPKIAAPPGISTILVDGNYVLADKEGRVLFTGDCGADCIGWVPLPGGFASRGMGDWTVKRDTDAPQWAYRGKPVYVSQLDDPTEVPSAATALRP